jgi:hypothetical protein
MNFAYLVPLLTLISVAMMMRLITDSGTEIGVRLFHVCLAIVAVTLCWMLDYWNFMGV